MSRILLVEDDDNNAYVVSTRLGRLGYEVVVARDGEAGLAQARSLRPDLVIMDLSLPVLDGWEAMRRLRAEPETAAIPIMVLSAHAMPEERRHALEAGADDFETKPVRIAELARKIETLLKR